MKSLQFYENIKPISDFNDVMNLTSYQPCPENWILILTDIKGSTKAIEEGRQKDVNLVGASAIAAIQNTMGSRQIPFAFGGDGATFVLPSEFEDQLKDELLRLKKHSEKNFNLELRVSIIPASFLIKQNADILIGKYALSEKNYMALFLGQGFQLAEKILKTENSEFELKFSENVEITSPPNLEHLSCRWDQIPTKHGHIASVLVMSRNHDQSSHVYKSILLDIKNYVRLVKFNPVADRNLTPVSLKKQFSFENKTKNNFHFLKRTFLLLLNYVFTSYTLKSKKNLISKVPVLEYINETFINSDYKKIDGILKMVIDCTTEEKNNLNSILNKYYDEGQIFYGVHLSESSLMTCVVHDLRDNQHIHFIDGNNGGYTLAAKNLKAQMKALLN